MTEAEWLACADPTPMLEYLRGKTSDRKLRLFAVGCALQFWDVIGDPGDEVSEQSALALEAAGRYTDGLAGRDTLDRCRDAIPVPAERAYEDDWWAADAAAAATDPDPHNAAVRMSGLLARVREFAWHQANCMAIGGLCIVRSREELAAMIRREGLRAARSELLARWEWLLANWDAERDASGWGQSAGRLREAGVAAILRDIFGNPLRMVTFEKSWRSSAAVGLARSMYDSRDFSAVPVLADALEEVGCDNADMLRHCRDGGTHVRGCWVVDGVLGKA